MSGFEHVLNVVKALLGENGCPWDKSQTPLSLRKYLIEECFETVDAICENDAKHVKEELGDVFFNLIFDALLYEKNGDFTLDECLHGIAEKLERRHPHVFAPTEKKAETFEEISVQWEKIKNNVEGRAASFGDDIPKSFPPLLRSTKLLSKAQKLGFYWKNADDAKSKVLEKLTEVQNAVTEKHTQHLEEEIGDLLFSVVGFARTLGVDCTLALNSTNEKFIKRFRAVEQKMNEKNCDEMLDF